MKRILIIKERINKLQEGKNSGHFQEARNPIKNLEQLLQDWSEFGEVEETGEFCEKVRKLVPQITGVPLSRNFNKLLDDWEEYGEIEDTDEFLQKIVRAVKRMGGPTLKLPGL